MNRRYMDQYVNTGCDLHSSVWFKQWLRRDVKKTQRKQTTNKKICTNGTLVTHFCGSVPITRGGVLELNIRPIKESRCFFVCSSKLLTPHFALISLCLAPVHSLSWVLPSIWYFPEPCVRFWDCLFFPSIFTYFYSTVSSAKSTPFFFLFSLQYRQPCQ